MTDDRPPERTFQDGAEGRGSIVLDVRQLSVEFRTRSGRVPAVRDVSFSLRRGQKLGIVGESGSGKSTLGLSLLSLIEPPGRIVGGEVILGGGNVLGLPDRQMKRIRGAEISLIFQDPLMALDPVKSIGSQIEETIRLHQGISRRAARQQAAELLADVEVPRAKERLDDYPHQFSGGMRQRVMIAIALANSPSVVVADEPTTALDVTTQAQVLAVLDRAATERGTAVILITHNMGVVAEFCDSCLVMYAGRVVESADVAELFSCPVHPYTEALLRSIPRASMRGRRLTVIGGSPPSLLELPPGCSFEPRCAVGKGLVECQTIRPASVEPGSDRRGHAAECHFAQQRWVDALCGKTAEASKP